MHIKGLNDILYGIKKQNTVNMFLNACFEIIMVILFTRKEIIGYGRKVGNDE